VAGQFGLAPPLFFSGPFDFRSADAMKKDQKKKERDKDAPSGEPQKPLVIHDISGRIPEMTDAQLTALAANARRLQASGTAQQKTSADALLPVIDAEMARRAAEKEEARKARLTKRKKGSGDDVPPEPSAPNG
jgi:hypothetical protein